MYLAVQNEPVRRKVALKVIKPGMDSRAVVARFEAERQALALMDHPNIAKVFDAGATDTGRPYFVMELVNGTPITEFCDECEFSMRERLELFVAVCHGVQHAHQKGVIHRDLKPKNLLVEVHDGRPIPKIIDFGIAKAMDRHLTELTLQTGIDQIVGTPLYMSPEQAERCGLDVDTRSDIYSLGVVLYELLTGSMPFDRQQLEGASLEEIRSLVRHQEPLRPSTRINTMGQPATTISEQRGTNPTALSHSLRHELDWIAMKALEKDRTRRYETASDFARDIQRYLCDETVKACPPSAAYRFGKFSRRHRVGLGVTILVSLALFAGLSLALWQAQVARREATRANIENDRAHETLRVALETVDAIYAAVTDQRLENESVHDPVKLKVLANTRPFYERLVQINPTDSPLQEQQARAYQCLGYIHERLGDYARAETAFKDAAVAFRELAASCPSEPALRLHLGQCLLSRGWILTCRNRRAEGFRALDEAVLTLAELAAAFPNHPAYATERAHAMCMRGLWYFDTARFAEALQDFGTVVQDQRPIVEAFPQDAWSRYVLAFAYQNYAMTVGVQRQFDEAEKYCQLSLHQKQILLRDQPANPTYRWHYAQTYMSWAASLADAERWEDAAVKCRQSNDLHHSLTTDYPDIPLYRMSYVPSLLTSARISAHLDDWVAVDQHYRQAVEQAEKMVALSDQDVRFCNAWTRAYREYSDFLIATGQYESAQGLYRILLDRLERLIASAPANGAYRSAYVSGVLNMTGLWSQDGRCEKAVALHRHAVDVLDDTIAALADENEYSDKDRALAFNNLAWLLSATPNEALRDPVESLLLAHDAVRLDPNGQTWNTLGLVCYRAGQYDEAVEALETAVEMMGDWGYGYNAFPLAMVYKQMGDEEKARYWYESGAERLDRDVLRDSGQVLLRQEAASVLDIDSSRP